MALITWSKSITSERNHLGIWKLKDTWIKSCELLFAGLEIVEGYEQESWCTAWVMDGEQRVGYQVTSTTCKCGMDGWGKLKNSGSGWCRCWLRLLLRRRVTFHSTAASQCYQLIMDVVEKLIGLVRWQLGGRPQYLNSIPPSCTNLL